MYKLNGKGRSGDVLSILNREGSVLDHIGSHYTDIDTGELLERIRNDLHPQQQEFFDNQNEIVGLSAGYGAGKTRSLCAMALKLMAQNVGFIGNSWTYNIYLIYKYMTQVQTDNPRPVLE